MDQLKAVGKAIRNSPRAIRKKFAHDQGHEKLDEDWYHSDDPINSGVSFYVKYLGSTEVSKTHGPGSTDDAVKTIVQHAKHRGGKLQKVQVTISSKFVRLVDVSQQMKLDELPLYRVSYCTVDPYYDKVFCYIARNHETKQLECHAFLCTKRSKAEAITLTVAQAFNIAFEKWQVQKQRKTSSASQGESGKSASNTSEGEVATNGQVPQTTSTQTATAKEEAEEGIGELVTLPPPPQQPPKPTQPPSTKPQLTTQQQPLVDVTVQQFSSMSVGVTPASPPPVASLPEPFSISRSKDDSHIDRRLLEVKTTISKATSLDYIKLEDDYDVEFTRLAEARSNPQLLAIGDHINRTDMKDDVMEFMRGEINANDLAISKSHEDLFHL